MSVRPESGQYSLGFDNCALYNLGLLVFSVWNVAVGDEITMTCSLVESKVGLKSVTM